MILVPAKLSRSPLSKDRSKRFVLSSVCPCGGSYALSFSHSDRDVVVGHHQVLREAKAVAFPPVEEDIGAD